MLHPKTTIETEILFSCDVKNMK